MTVGLIEKYLSLPPAEQAILTSAANDRDQIRALSVARLYFGGAADGEIVELLNHLRRL